MKSTPPLRIELLEARIAPASAAVVELSGLTSTDGFKISGAAAGDYSGFSVSGAGDINGDGIDDVIVGAFRADPNGSESGASYVVFGSRSGFAANLDLSTLTGGNGFKISGEAAGDRSGSSVSGAGDINGDGIDDLIVGAHFSDSNGNYSGASYVVFGSRSGFAANLNLSTLTGSNGFKISGAAAGDFSGYSVSGAGDINGDGIDDLIVGAFRADPNGSESGASYVVFGSRSGFAANLNLATLTDGNGFTISGVAGGDFSGYSVSGAGDINGDGIDDLIVGAFRADPNGSYSGASYVVFGSRSGLAANLNLATLTGGNGFKISGVAADDFSGYSVSGTGDINGDGIDDLIVGAFRADPNGSASGASYVVFGSRSGFAANLDLATLTGGNGFKISGVAADDYSGRFVSGAGDINGDGINDLIVGAPSADPNGSASGVSYVVYGSRSGFAANLNLSTLTDGNGFTINGVAADDRSGFRVSRAGDINGDGIDDLIVGAPGADSNGSYSGASYVVFGKAAVAPLPVLSIDDVSVAEGASGTAVATFTVSLSAASSQSVTVQYATADGSGVAPDDYAALALTTLTFDPGEVSKTITVLVNGDTLFEGNETFFVNLSGAANATIADEQGEGTIDNDDQFPALSIGDVSLSEGADGTVLATFNVSLSDPSGQPVTVQYSTVDGSASAGTDYAAVALSTLTFAPGEISQTVVVSINGDTDLELNETFFVNLSSPAGATIAGGQGQGQGTIGNDDVVISSDGRTATLTDVDGDRLKVTTNKGTLTNANFVFDPDGRLQTILIADAGFNRADLTFTATSTPDGNGLADVPVLNASGVDLGKVTIDGRFGEIMAGDGNLKTTALRKLIAGSIGTDEDVNETLTSEINGALGKLIVRRDVNHASITVLGKLGSASIGGDLLGTGGDGARLVAALAHFGSLAALGGFGGGVPEGVYANSIGTFTLAGKMSGAAVAAVGKIGSVKVGGDVANGSLIAAARIPVVKLLRNLSSDDPENPVIVAALGRIGGSRADAMGIDRLIVRGDVGNAQILLGYKNRLIEEELVQLPRNPDASAGSVVVSGNWSASSLVAGVLDATEDGFGQNDTLITGDRTRTVIARIASIVIKGTATGSAGKGEHFGITAQSIGSLSINGENIALEKNKRDDILLDEGNGNFRLVEIKG